MGDYKQKVREEPRVSVNKLAEYLATNKAARRERILLDAKYAPTYQVIRYDGARQIMQQFMVSGNGNTQEIQAKINDMLLKSPGSDFDERMVKANVEALEYFSEMAPSLAFPDCALTLGAHAPALFKLNGVEISVRPDLRTSAVGKTGPAIGGIKFNIVKGAVHTKESAEYVGAVLIEYLNQTEGGCSHALCSTIDVFGKKVIPAPKATANRMKDVASACTEIARAWPSL